MKYFIRKRRDCISSVLLAGGEEEKKWRRGIKKNVFFGNYCVCVTNGGEVRGLGVGRKGRWKKCRKRRRYVDSCEKKNSVNLNCRC